MTGGATAADQGPGAEGPALLRIGEAAERAGVSPRTLRWYEELGLVAPSARSAGGARRYDAGDVARTVHIRELQSLLGMDLGEIRTILQGGDALDDLREQYHAAADRTRRREILTEASAITEKLLAVVDGRQALLADLRREFEARADRCRAALEELDGPAR